MSLFSKTEQLQSTIYWNNLDFHDMKYIQGLHKTFSFSFSLLTGVFIHVRDDPWTHTVPVVMAVHNDLRLLLRKRSILINISWLFPLNRHFEWFRKDFIVNADTTKLSFSCNLNWKILFMSEHFMCTALIKFFPWNVFLLLGYGNEYRHKNYRYVDFWIAFNASQIPYGPVGRCCKIHQLHLCRGVRLPSTIVLVIWHKTIGWWGSSNAGALGNME